MDYLHRNTLAAVAYSAAIYFIAIFVCQWLTTFPQIGNRLQKTEERFGAIDGLRGVLALGVFIHHSATAPIYFATGKWEWSASPVFNHLGQSTVALFFMITAFLFTTRITSDKPVSWSGLFISRFFRLTPLYLVFMAGVVSWVFHFGGGYLREPAERIVVEILQWLAFVMFGRPDINGVERTWIMSAGVNWSLRYEWLFYLSLPVLYWVMKPFRAPWAARATGGAFVLALFYLAFCEISLTGHKLYALHFTAGAIVALLAKDHQADRVFASTIFRIAGWTCLCSPIAFRSAYSALPILLSMLFFASVVADRTSSSVLSLRGIRWLGEISYGLYLLHGLILYWLVSKLQNAGFATSIGGYSMLAVTGALVTVGVASWLHFAVELPGIRVGKRMARRIERKPVLRPSHVLSDS